MAASDNKNILAALEATWQAEMEGFYTYTAPSKSEADPHRRNALRGLAMAEKHHADLWAERIKELGGPEPRFSGSPNGQADSLANRVGGADLPQEDAERFVEHLAKDKNQLIEALARERLNTTEEGLSKPMVFAISGAISTAVGAFIPILPFFFMTGIRAVIVAAVVSPIVVAVSCRAQLH